jgi:hypothetical protein
MFKSDREGGMREGLRVPANEVAELYDLLFGQDDEGPCESLLRHAPAIEAGLMPGWKLDRSQAGALLWTTPSGRQYKSTLDGSSYAPYRH